jgi:hypothetical protein
MLGDGYGDDTHAWMVHKIQTAMLTVVDFYMVTHQGSGDF